MTVGLTSGLCCALITTVWTRLGTPYSYSTVTCDFPSGLRYGRRRSFRTSAMRWQRRCDSAIGRGISSGGLGTGVADHHPLVSGPQVVQVVASVADVAATSSERVTPVDMSGDCSCTDTAIPHDW